MFRDSRVCIQSMLSMRHLIRFVSFLLLSSLVSISFKVWNNAFLTLYSRLISFFSINRREYTHFAVLCLHISVQSTEHRVRRCKCHYASNDVQNTPPRSLSSLCSVDLLIIHSNSNFPCLLFLPSTPVASHVPPALHDGIGSVGRVGIVLGLAVSLPDFKIWYRVQRQSVVRVPIFLTNLLTLKCFRSRMAINRHCRWERSLLSSSGPCAARGCNWTRAVNSRQCTNAPMIAPSKTIPSLSLCHSLPSFFSLPCVELLFPIFVAQTSNRR